MSATGEIVEKRGYYVFEWRIEEFTMEELEEDGQWCSPPFKFTNGTWFLKIGEERNSKPTGWLGLYLVPYNPDFDNPDIEWTAFVSYRLGIRVVDGTPHKCRSFSDIFLNPYICLGESKIIRKEQLVREKSKFYPDDLLTVYCEMRLADQRQVNAESQTVLHNDLTVLSEDFKNLLSCSENTDVTINVKNRKFCVHSQILAARSPAFAAMLKHEMKEKRTGSIDIPDCDPGAFKVLLMFLYSGQPDGLSRENSIHLYIAADKYNITELKKNCVDFMYQNMSEETVCDILSLAIMHNDRELLVHGTDFFLHNAEKILQTVKWMSFIKAQPVQSNELTIKAFKYISAK